jgi:hypothetical protein
MLLILFTRASSSHAHGGFNISFPSWDFGIGPSFAYIPSGDGAFAANLDLSLSHYIVTASVNLKYMKYDGTGQYGPQFELTVWTGFNWGGGAGFLRGDHEGPVYHIFIGIPFGDDTPFHWLRVHGSVYVEPYYRANFFKDDVFHEFGMMAKYNTFTI